MKKNILPSVTIYAWADPKTGELLRTKDGQLYGWAVARPNLPGMVRPVNNSLFGTSRSIESALLDALTKAKAFDPEVCAQRVRLIEETAERKLAKAKAKVEQLQAEVDRLREVVAE